MSALETRIREIIVQTNRFTGLARTEWYPIADLHDELPDVPRVELENELLRMEELDDFHIVPETNQSQLTGRKREFALIVGGKPKHLVRVS